MNYLRSAASWSSAGSVFALLMFRLAAMEPVGLERLVLPVPYWYRRLAWKARRGFATCRYRRVPKCCRKVGSFLPGLRRMRYSARKRGRTRKARLWRTKQSPKSDCGSAIACVAHRRVRRRCASVSTFCLPVQFLGVKPRDFTFVRIAQHAVKVIEIHPDCVFRFMVGVAFHGQAAADLT